MVGFPEQLEEYKQNARVGANHGPDELVFDAWTALSFKRVLGNRKSPGLSWMAPTWVGEHNRRLRAYKVLQGYIDNAARFFLQTTDQELIDAHREYGDCALLRDQILAALLGDGQEWMVEGAEGFDPSLEEEDEEATEAALPPSPAVEAIELPEGEGEATETPEEAPEENTLESRQAHELQEWLNQWAKDERFRIKLLENERNSVGLGDGVYTLGWSGGKGRNRLRVWDPGFYFPLLDTGNEDDFPETVHIAWEEEHPEEEKAAQGKTIIRRITWEMVDLEEEYTPDYPGAEPTKRCCFMSDGTWFWDSQGKRDVMDLALSEAKWSDYEEDDGTVVEYKDISLDIDFIPVVHVPNTVAVLNHYGKSSLATVLQLLDDLSNTDTDLQLAASTAGNPIVGVSGVRFGAQKPKFRPGEMVELGESGKLSWVDTSRALDALLKYLETMLDRLSVNSRLPAALLGRVKPSEVEAGVIMSMSFGPLKSMIEEMRLVRDEKYPLLAKFNWRMAHVNGQDDVPAVWHDCHLQLGSYMPNDLSAVITAVAKLLEQKAISLETAVLMLIEAGIEIDDAVEEIRRIQSRDFTGANALLEATGDPQAVFDYLGIEPSSPDLVAPPPPPTPGAAGAGVGTGPTPAPGQQAPAQIQPIPRTPPTPPVSPV